MSLVWHTLVVFRSMWLRRDLKEVWIKTFTKFSFFGQVRRICTCLLLSNLLKRIVMLVYDYKLGCKTLYYIIGTSVKLGCS
jgi:hypothetical protein